MQTFRGTSSMKYKLMFIFTNIFCYFPSEQKQEKYLRKKKHKILPWFLHLLKPPGRVYGDQVNKWWTPESLYIAFSLHGWPYLMKKLIIKYTHLLNYFTCIKIESCDYKPRVKPWTLPNLNVSLQNGNLWPKHSQYSYRWQEENTEVKKEEKRTESMFPPPAHCPRIFPGIKISSNPKNLLEAGLFCHGWGITDWLFNFSVSK